MARLTKFSDAISSRPWFCRRSSLLIAAAISGSVSASVRQITGHPRGRRAPEASSRSCARLGVADLIDPPLMPAALERRVQPERDDLVGQAERHDAAAHREDVGIVVQARQPRGVQVVAERGADAGDLVGSHLLALSAAAEDDPAVRAARDDLARDVDADRRIVHRRLAVGPVIGDAVPEPLQRLFEVLFEEKAGVIGADRDAHGRELYYGWRVEVPGAACIGAALS